MTTKVGLYRDNRNKHRPWVVRWFGEYEPETGKQRQYSRSFVRKRDAEGFRSSKQAELDKGGVRDVHDDIAVGEFARRFLESKARNLRPATRRSYGQTLEQLVAFVGENTKLRLVTPEVADGFVATRDRVSTAGSGFSPWSRRLHLGNAKIAFNSAVRWGYLAQNPFKHIKLTRSAPRRWHHLKPQDFQALINVVSNPRWEAFYLLAYTTGARFGELFNLTWANVDFEHGAVRIQDRPASAQLPPFHVKDHEARTLLLPKQAVEALVRWQADAPESVPFVLLTAERWMNVQKKWQLCRMERPWKKSAKIGQLEWVDWENRYMVNNVGRDVRSHLRRAGIATEAPMTIHTFRKSFGQNHANAGTPLHVLQQLMGHSSITTTREFYLQAADANEQTARKQYEELLDGPSAETCVQLLYGASSARSDEKGNSVSHVQQKT